MGDSDDSDESSVGSRSVERERKRPVEDLILSPIVHSRSKVLSASADVATPRLQKRLRTFSSPEVGGAQKRSDHGGDEAVSVDILKDTTTTTPASVTFTVPASLQLPSSTTTAVERGEASNMGDDEQPRAKFDLRSALAETTLSSGSATMIPDGIFVDSVKDVFGRMQASRELHTLFSDPAAFEKGVMRGKLRGLLGLFDMILGKDDRLKDEWKEGVKQLGPIMHGIYLGHLNRVLAESEAKMQEAMDDRLVYHMEHDAMSEQEAGVRCKTLVRRIAALGGHFASARMTAALSSIQGHLAIGEEAASETQQPTGDEAMNNSHDGASMTGGAAAVVAAAQVGIGAAAVVAAAQAGNGGAADGQLMIPHLGAQRGRGGFRGDQGRFARNGGRRGRGRGSERGYGNAGPRGGGYNGYNGPGRGYSGYSDERGGNNGRRGRGSRGRQW
jgi:hypothetical protein